mmetsp:Transcript_121/g.201  ORF Transcript_121/g.201 Transcript_121/m.201 type:complete len:256 (-) Transcript_121:1098-1865(-)
MQSGLSSLELPLPLMMSHHPIRHLLPCPDFFRQQHWRQRRHQPRHRWRRLCFSVYLLLALHVFLPSGPHRPPNFLPRRFPPVSLRVSPQHRHDWQRGLLPYRRGLQVCRRQEPDHRKMRGHHRRPPNRRHFQRALRRPYPSNRPRHCGRSFYDSLYLSVSSCYSLPSRRSYSWTWRHSVCPFLQLLQPNPRLPSQTRNLLLLRRRHLRLLLLPRRLLHRPRLRDLHRRLPHPLRGRPHPLLDRVLHQLPRTQPRR